MSPPNFSSDPTTSINTTYPAGVTAEAVIAALHNHDTYIRATCPELISYELVSGSVGLDQTAEYSVTDKKPVGKTTYTMSITNRSDGVETRANAKAPIGAMVLDSKWIATPTELQERIWIDANMVVKKLVKSGTEKNHPEAHKAIFAKGGPAVTAAA